MAKSWEKKVDDNSDLISFSDALQALYDGMVVSRHGVDWALIYVDKWAVHHDSSAGKFCEEQQLRQSDYGAFIGKVDTHGCQPWSPTQEDILGEDWFVVESDGD